MKRQIKTLALLMAVMVVTALLAACAGDADNGPKISVTVKITDEAQLLNTPVEVPEKAKAGDAIKAACQKANLAYTVKDGMYDNFGGKASTQEDGWLLYVNDAIAEVGADSYAIEEGDILEFRYANYAAAYKKQQ